MASRNSDNETPLTKSSGTFYHVDEPSQTKPASDMLLDDNSLGARMCVRLPLSTYKPPTTRTTSTESTFSQCTTEIRKLDRALETEVGEECLGKSINLATPQTAVANPYEHWKCGFDSEEPLDAPGAVPDTKDEFVRAVKGELQNTASIQNGLTAYLASITSGKHHALSPKFIDGQIVATHKSVQQLSQIRQNLGEVLKEAEAIQETSKELHPELLTAFTHAQPWIKRIRNILVSSHVFYKINYVLGADKVRRQFGKIP